MNSDRWNRNRRDRALADFMAGPFAERHDWLTDMARLLREQEDTFRGKSVLPTVTPEPWLKPKPDPLACYDCLLPYTDPGFADFVVPDDVWAKISPTGDEGGILCATCMFRRMEALGIRSDGRFRSGPCAQHEWEKPAAGDASRQLCGGDLEVLADLGFPETAQRIRNAIAAAGVK